MLRNPSRAEPERSMWQCRAWRRRVWRFRGGWRRYRGHWRRQCRSWQWVWVPSAHSESTTSAPQQTSPLWRDELAADDLCDNDDHEDEERGDWKEVWDDTEVMLEAEQQGHKNTFSSQVYNRDVDQFFYDHRIKKLTIQKLCETMWWSYSQKKN
jgi:hypothetical protein